MPKTDGSLEIFALRQLPPTALKNNIPYSQARRFKRICSSNYDFKTNTDKLRQVLKEQKYSEKIADDAINKGQALDRGLLLSERSPQTEERRENLVLTFNNKSPNVEPILIKHFNIYSKVNASQGLSPPLPE